MILTGCIESAPRMITIVSTWLCKCGAHVKVVGETPKGNTSARQAAACPRCGDTQVVYVEKILSIMIEKENGELRSQGLA